MAPPADKSSMVATTPRQSLVQRTLRCIASLAVGMRRLWAVLLLGCLAPLVQAAPALVLQDTDETVDLWPAATVMRDATTRLSIEEVLALPGAFSEPVGTKASFGIVRDALWVRTNVKVAAGQPGRWVLQVDYPSLNRIDVYVVAPDGSYKHAVMGNDLPYRARPIPGTTHAMELDLRPGQSHQLLMRVQASGPMIVPLRLLKPGSFQTSETTRHMLQGIVGGIALCMLLYALIQCIAQKQAMFAYYAVFLASYGIYFFTVQGLSVQYFWPDSLWLARHMPALAYLLGLAAGALFLDKVLDVQSLSRRTSLALRGLAAVCVLVLTLLAVGVMGVGQALAAATLLGVMPLVLALPSAWTRSRGGDPAMRLIFAGWLLYYTGLIVMIGLLRGFIEPTLWSRYAFQFGAAAEMIMWLVVMGWRVSEMRDAAEQAKLERDTLRTIAHTDPLTGLANRRGLQLAAQARLRSRRPSQLVAVYMIDLDGFKQVNDTHGHDLGDQLLASTAQRFQRQVRPSDIVARLGGDEFVVVVDGLHLEEEAEMIALKLLHAIDPPFELPGARCQVGATIGYAICPHDGDDVGSLLKRADAAMYAGKQAGKRRVQRGAASAWLATLSSPTAHDGASKQEQTDPDRSTSLS